MSIPHHIIRKSRRYFQNTVTGKYIHQANLDATVAREKLAKEAQVNKDALIRRKRWDLNID